MPLLISPIDGSPMRQINRYGIEIDVCPASGGIWLDKGELEKILHILREEIESTQISSERARGDERVRERDVYVHDDEDFRRYKEKGYYGSGKYYKKESGFSRIMDLFDF